MKKKKHFLEPICSVGICLSFLISFCYPSQGTGMGETGKNRGVSYH